MALFELTELASYLQSDLDTATATLLRDIATGLVEQAYGATLPATPPAVVKGVGLAVAARGYVNPEQLAAEGIGDYNRRFDTASMALTPAERRSIASAAGFGAAVYSVRVSTPTDTAWPYVA